MNLFYKVDTFRLDPIRITDYNAIEKQDFNDILIVSYAPNPNDSIENYIKDLQFLNRSHKEFVVVVLFGDASYIEHIPMQNIDALVHCPSYSKKTISKTAHLLFGAIGTNKDLSSNRRYIQSQMED